jgi:hypothetical protein
VLLTVTASVLPAAAPAAPQSVFYTPQWAAVCLLAGPAGKPSSAGVLMCVRPSDGFTIAMGPRDGPRWRRERWARGFRDPSAAARRLSFGQRWAVRPWRCVSRKTGLTCSNKVGHGWWLGRYLGYKTF